MVEKGFATDQQVVDASNGAVTTGDPRVAPIVESVEAIRRYAVGWSHHR